MEDKKLINIGVSDIPTIMGLNPYKTRVQLFLEKTGRLEKPESTSAQRVGKIIEKSIVEMYEQETGYKVTSNPTKLKCPTYPRIVGYLDGEIDMDGFPGVLEVKNTSDDSGECKPIWELQLQFYLYMRGVEEGAIAALFNGKDFKIFEVALNIEEVEAAIEEVKKFIYCIDNDITPSPTDLSDISLLYPKAVSPSIEASDEVWVTYNKLKQVREDKKKLSKIEDALELEIKDHLKDNEMLMYKGATLVTFKNSKGRTTTDWAKAVEELKLDVEKYKVTAPEGPRVFLVKK